MKPSTHTGEIWPRCSFFGVYDGHGGSKCADFLRDNLHQFVIRDSNFPVNPKLALENGFLAAEREFLYQCLNQETVEKSGSCAIVALIVGDVCYVANVGDSRAIMSGDRGSRIYPLSKDHKPGEEQENKRINENGGTVYQSQAAMNNGQKVIGPLRVFPGRLSVCRTFGDIEAKLQQFGGNPGVIISTPDIKAFKVKENYDFIILASDGVYDKLSNKEVVQTIWKSFNENRVPNLHRLCGLGVEHLLQETFRVRSFDNVTAVMIGLNGLKEYQNSLI